ncbi:hypothetical protein PNQ92_13950 [Halobacterium salinarum]|nr:hypothetical protein [Halobacterium salinarum]MDL0126496.1 hypothetical protein [Halobacterium salinarum]
MTADDVDPENPRPEGHYPRFADNEWHYISDELAQTISLGPAGDGEDGQDWVLTYTPERENTEDREKILVRLTPRALHELYIETKASRLTSECTAIVLSAISAASKSISTRRSPTNVGNPATTAAGPSIRAHQTGSATTCSVRPETVGRWWRGTGFVVREGTVESGKTRL